MLKKVVKLNTFVNTFFSDSVNMFEKIFDEKKVQNKSK